MNEETFVQKLVHGLVFVGLCAVIIAIGWHEPLRYRFMSPQEIYLIEHPPALEIVPEDVGAWMRDPSRRTLLDEPRRSVRGGVNSFQTKGALDRTDNRQ